ncbi:MAG: hypothetical protein HYT70_03565 [Candidatus Aenigmarchaeota archaeon]|nr:hypothetical protein [Candidatus Aenigmarchaeota archaeon]
MPLIELDGVGESFIVTRLDKISITNYLGTDKQGYSFKGHVSGRADNRDYDGSAIQIPTGYIIRIRCESVEDHGLGPLYFSTSGTVSKNAGLYKTKFSDKVRINFLESEQITLLDNVLVLHASKFEPVIFLDASGEFQAKKVLDYKGQTPTFDEVRTDFYECHMHFSGIVHASRGISGELMELDGRFKLKPRKGVAKRDGGKPYKLRGDQEFVIEGHVACEMGSLSTYFNDNNITPSFVKISAEGELVI